MWNCEGGLAKLRPQAFVANFVGASAHEDMHIGIDKVCDKGSKTMKRTLRWVLRGLLVLCALMLAAWLFKDSLFRTLTERRLREETGLTINIGQLKVNLISASVVLKEITSLNPPGFGDTKWLHVREASGALDVQQARTNRLHFNDLKFHLTELTVIRKPDGLFNLEAVKQSILAHAFRNGSKRKLNFSFGGIDKLELSLERVRYIDEQQPANSLQLDLDIQNEVVTNLRTEEEFNQWANAFVIRIALKEYLKNPKLNGLKSLWER